MVVCKKKKNRERSPENECDSRRTNAKKEDGTSEQRKRYRQSPGIHQNRKKRVVRYCKGGVCSEINLKKSSGYEGGDYNECESSRAIKKHKT